MVWWGKVRFGMDYMESRNKNQEEIMNTKEKIEALVDYIKTKEYGTIIYHGEIAGVIEEKYHTTAYRSIVNAAKKKLLLIGKMIESVRRSGYKIVMPDDYNKHTINCMVRASKDLKKGMEIHESVNYNDMTLVGKQEHDYIGDKLRKTNARIVGDTVEVNTFCDRRENALIAAARNN